MYPVVAISQPKREVIYISIRGPIEVGRECDGILLGDAQVSRRHLLLDVEHGQPVVTDLGSTNGTTLDGLPIVDPVTLVVGDVIGLGHSTLELCEEVFDPSSDWSDDDEGAGEPNAATAPDMPAPPAHPRNRPEPTLTASDPPPPFSAPPPPSPQPAVAPTSPDGPMPEPEAVVAPPPPAGPGSGAASVASRSAAPVVERPIIDPRSSIDLVAIQVAETGVDLGGLNTDQGTVTIVFSDIESSTERNMALGDQEWFQVLGEHNSIIRNLVTQYNGTEVKNQGDGFMMSFPGAHMALACMVEVQNQLEARAQADPERAVRVRIGLHTGEVLVDDDGDLFGKHVVVAARIADLALGGEILVSSLTREITSARGDVVFGEARHVELKGIGGSHTVYPVDWTSSLPD